MPYARKSVVSAPVKRVAGRRYRTKSKVVKKKQAGRKLATVSMVKKLIHKNAENKFVGGSNTYQTTPIISGVTDCRPLIPSLSQGTTDNTRIGNRVTPRGLLVTGSVYITPDVIPGNAPLMVRLLFMKYKPISYIPNLTAVNGVDFSHLLDFGNGEHSFNGSLTDYRCPVNTDSFTVIKDMKIAISKGTDEENLHCIRNFKLWIPCPKVLDYNDGHTYPQNFAPFMAVGYTSGDGVVPNPADTTITIDYTYTLYYEDA